MHRFKGANREFYIERKGAKKKNTKAWDFPSLVGVVTNKQEQIFDYVRFVGDTTNKGQIEGAVDF